MRDYSKLTTIYQNVQEEMNNAFEIGYEQGVKSEEYSVGLANEYTKGLHDAWEAARKIADMDEYDRTCVVFDRLAKDEFPFRKYSPIDAINRIKKFESQKKCNSCVNYFRVGAICCKRCKDFSNYEQIEQGKSCFSCKYADIDDHNYPCSDCDEFYNMFHG